MRTRLSDLTEILLQQRNDLIGGCEPLSDDPGDFLDYLGGPEYFDESCIYDSVDDDTAIWLLNDWLDGTANVGWHVNCELSKLLAKRGHLIRERAEAIVRTIADSDPEVDCLSWAKRQLCLSFLPCMEDGETLAVRLLGQAPSDFRDGILFACYRLNTQVIYEAVKRNVRRWEAEMWIEGTGEHWLVNQMVQLWDETFPGGDHEDIRVLCQPSE